MADPLEAHDHGQQTAERLPANRMMDEVHTSRNSLNVQDRHSEQKIDSLPSLEIVDHQNHQTDASQKTDSTQHADSGVHGMPSDSMQYTDSPVNGMPSDSMQYIDSGVRGMSSDTIPGPTSRDIVEDVGGKATPSSQTAPGLSPGLDQSTARIGGPNLSHTGNFQ